MLSAAPQKAAVAVGVGLFSQQTEMGGEGTVSHHAKGGSRGSEEQIVPSAWAQAVQGAGESPSLGVFRAVGMWHWAW